MVKYGIVPIHWIVAIVTLIAAGNMGWVLACSDGAIVATFTGANDLGVVHGSCRGEDNNRMAILADVGCGDMGRIFADCIYSVVAARAIGCNVCMIKIGWCPGNGGVAVITSIAACNVIWVLTRCDGAVVTTEAGSNDVGMINQSCRNPGHNRVTIFAGVGSSNVGRVFTGCVSPVVATDTVVCDTFVIKHGDVPSEIVVAGVAFRSGGDVPRG